jgi:hypothetical protein
MSIFQKSLPNQRELAQCDCGEVIGISADNWVTNCPSCGTGSNNWTFLAGMRAPDPETPRSSSFDSGPGLTFKEFCITWGVRFTVAYGFYWYFFD